MLPNIQYEDLSKKLSINVINNEHDIYSLWLENGDKVLECRFSKSGDILELTGQIGDIINNAPLPPQEKISRSFEALNNGLWDYFNPPKSKKIGLK